MFTITLTKEEQQYLLTLLALNIGKHQKEVAKVERLLKDVSTKEAKRLNALREEEIKRSKELYLKILRG